MVAKISIICLSILLVLSCRDVFSSSSSLLCSDIRQLHQERCAGHDNILAMSRRGKAGPAGQKGEKGDPGIVDYGLVQEIIEEKFSKLKLELDSEIATCKQEIQRHKQRFESLESELMNLTFTDCDSVNPESAEVKSTNGGIFEMNIKTKRGNLRLKAFCDLETDEGGWIVFQRRMDGSVDFYRGWDDYVNGFGNLTGEFWMGLEKLYLITSSDRYELRVDLENWSGQRRYAKYTTFRVGNAQSNYAIHLSGYSGDASDSIARENGQPFSTKDRDHDSWSGHCAQAYQGAWWYGSCHNANLNGLYSKGRPDGSPHASGVTWRYWEGYDYSLKISEMKIRRATG